MSFISFEVNEIEEVSYSHSLKHFKNQIKQFSILIMIRPLKSDSVFSRKNPKEIS